MSGVASTPPSGNLDIGALSVSGQRETANAFRVNGSDVQEDVNMGVAIVPTLDSIAELKVLTDDFDARLGNQSGGQVLVTTRSGTEHLHGSVFEYYRDTALDARSYFSLELAPFRPCLWGVFVLLLLEQVWVLLVTYDEHGGFMITSSLQRQSHRTDTPKGLHSNCTVRRSRRS